MVPNDCSTQVYDTNRDTKVYQDMVQYSWQKKFTRAMTFWQESEHTVWSWIGGQSLQKVEVRKTDSHWRQQIGLHTLHARHAPVN